MITYIAGTLTDMDGNTITIEAYGVGYEIMVPDSVLSMLPGINENIRIYTYQNVREDALDLYGFLSKDDLKIFKQLITVNGIGPKGALNILSSITPDELRMAVLCDDFKTIQKAQGIGAKTAQRLIMELRDKISPDEDILNRNPNTLQGTALSIRDEAVAALVSLGYSNSESLNAVNRAGTEDGMTSEDVIRKALKFLAFM